MKRHDPNTYLPWEAEANLYLDEVVTVWPRAYVRNRLVPVTSGRNHVEEKLNEFIDLKRTLTS